MTQNINSPSQGETEAAALANSLLLNDLQVAASLGADVSSAVVAAGSSQVVLSDAVAAAAPWGVGAAAVAEAAASTDSGKDKVSDDVYSLYPATPTSPAT